MLVVVCRMCDLFSTRNFWDINESENRINLEAIKFMMDPGYSNIKDPHFPSLMALVAIEQARIVFIDGYHQNLFYRCQRLFVQMLAYVLPDKLTVDIVKSRILYMKVNTENEYLNTKIHIMEEAEKDGHQTFDLSKVSWEDYSRDLFPEFYEGETKGETTLN